MTGALKMNLVVYERNMRWSDFLLDREKCDDQLSEIKKRILEPEEEFLLKDKIRIYPFKAVFVELSMITEDETS